MFFNFALAIHKEYRKSFCIHGLNPANQGKSAWMSVGNKEIDAQ